MNRTAALIPTMLVAALLTLPALAQHSAVTDADGIPTVAAQMHLMTTRIDLNHHQRAQVRTILDELHATTVTAVHDASASPQQRFDTIRNARFAVDHKLRAILTPDQQKQLDQLEHEPHAELHGKIVNAASLPQ